MKHHGRLLPRAESLSRKIETDNPWDLMHLLQSVEHCKPIKKQTFSFALFKK